MTIANHLRLPPLLLTGLAAVASCSLTIPAEDELFAGGRSSGGSSGDNTAGTTMAGSPALGGSGNASGSAGTSAGGQNGGADGGSEGGGSGEGPLNEAGAGGEGGGTIIVLPPAELLLHYTFDDVSEFMAIDETLNELDGVLSGSVLPVGVPGIIDGALQLDGAQKQYVQLPDNILIGKSAVSVSSWIRLAKAIAWDRLFDFNSDESNWFYFSPTGWNTAASTFGTRCAARTPSALAPEITLTETVSINAWHHVAIVFAKPYLRYYLDGTLKAQVDNVSFATSDLAATDHNWIGRSVYPADPYLTALVDDFRIYTGALTQEEVTELSTPE